LTQPNPAVSLDGTTGDGLDLSVVGDVGDDGDGRAAAVLDLGDQRTQAGLAAGGHDNLGALLGKA
jgi:hypothetical protein